MLCELGDPSQRHNIKFNLNYNTGDLSIRSQNEIQRAARGPESVARPAKSRLLSIYGYV